jgi:formate-dependent nitrite reductase membrane component NrfD
MSGAAYVVAAIADLFGNANDRPTARIGRYVSLAALLPCPVLLILDLHRPSRFFNMLRVLKLRSPMSLGTWGLTVFSGFSACSAAIEAAEDGRLGQNRVSAALLRVPRRPLGAVGALPAFFMSGYTGVLLGATAVPLWAKNAPLLGPLFLCSSLSTAASAMAALLARHKDVDAKSIVKLETVERVATGAEVGLLLASRARLGSTGAPVVEGRTGRLLRIGVIGAGIVVPAGLQAVNRRHARPLIQIASALTLAGGFILRYVVVAAGRTSADDPHATFDFTRRP